MTMVGTKGWIMPGRSSTGPGGGRSCFEKRCCARAPAPTWRLRIDLAGAEGAERVLDILRRRVFGPERRDYGNAALSMSRR